MTLLFVPSELNPKEWTEALHQVDANIPIEIWPQVSKPEDVQFALVWWYPPGVLNKFPNLKCIASIGAGVDYILQDAQRPNTPIVRVVDKLLTRDMTQYIVWAVLNHSRNADFFKKNQERKLWIPKKTAPQTRIGIMGMGELGRDAALKLTGLGFEVYGWSRTEKQIPGIKHFHGNDQLNQFLSHCDILICLLPLTSATKGILNAQLFKQLPQDAYVINAARGAHLVEEDLLTALNNNHLSGACLDVFRVEPLPENHSFWQHPKITITPHIASKTNPRSVAQQIVENYHRAIKNEPLANVINTNLEY